MLFNEEITNKKGKGTCYRASQYSATTRRLVWHLDWKGVFGSNVDTLAVRCIG